MRAARNRSRRHGSPVTHLILGCLLLIGCGEPETPADPADILAARAAGEALLQQDRIDEARAEFRRLAELAPTEAAGYAGLGLVALRAGELEDAERWLEEARERAPEDQDLELALARVRWEAGDLEGARRILEASLARDSSHARSWWALGELLGERGPSESARIQALSSAARLDPGNLAVRFELARAAFEAGRTDRALTELEALRQQAPDIPRPARPAFERALDAARNGRANAALEALSEFGDYFEVTAAYQAGLESVRPPPRTLVGIPRLEFSHALSLRIQEQEAVLAALRFAEASDLAGLAALGPDAPAGRTGESDVASIRSGAIAAGNFDGDADEDLFWSPGEGGRILRVELGRYVDVSAETGLSGVGAVRDAVFADVDDDRRPDLVVTGARTSVYRQTPEGAFVPLPLPGMAGAEEGGNRLVIADLDQDGDLDIYVARAGPNRLYRNDGDGTFTEIGGRAGVAGPSDAATLDAAFADLDDDRDLDLLLAEGAGGLRLLSNQRSSRFEDATAAAGLADPSSGTVTAVAVGDVDNDGRMDILVSGPAGLTVLRGRPDGAFDAAGRAVFPLGGLEPVAIELLDFDNDGWLDAAVAGREPGGSGLRLLRNGGDGSFADAARFLPEVPEEVLAVESIDYNEDGDADLLYLAGGGGPGILRNDGGNANHYLKIELTGLGEGSRKNNRFGIGARIEVRTGDVLQARTVTDPTVLIGLDGRLKADVIRVEWPNGVAQDLYFPGTDQELIEQQTLKGSCPLLYVWNGERFEFVGDVMWKSALGMPLGILGGAGDRTYAPAFPSQEYRRLPAGVLQPRDGEYVLQLTEELWETIYVDEVELLAVDHPDSIEVFVDEKFMPPAPTDLALWRVEERRLPAAAVDGEGRDQLDALSAHDFRYADDLVPGRFQGLAEPHELVLDLGPEARGDEVVLYLRGWVFPSDASINVALAQSDEHAARWPSLDVIGPDGEWRTAIRDLGIPSGKDKTVVADLRGLFPTDDRRVRIRTNLMVYWDEAFWSRGPVAPAEEETRITRLEPSSADFHYRGFSREYRKGGPYGPHWFDYDDVSTEPKWSDLAGTYTRYGDVTPLLQEGDDMYVVANAGDEITLRFAAAELPALPEGWARTWLAYTDGWVKDGDLNTATGDRVDPLPFRAQSSYPYGPDESYPDDPAHGAFLETYQTREVRPRF